METKHNVGEREGRRGGEGKNTLGWVHSINVPSFLPHAWLVQERRSERERKRRWGKNRGSHQTVGALWVLIRDWRQRSGPREEQQLTERDEDPCYSACFLEWEFENEKLNNKGMKQVERRREIKPGKATEKGLREWHAQQVWAQHPVDHFTSLNAPSGGTGEWRARERQKEGVLGR